MLHDQKEYSIVSKMAIDAPGKPTSPFYRLDEQRSRMGDVARRIDALADQLCGAVPQAIDDADAKSGAPGLFGSIEAAVVALDEYASQIERALGRIQNHLP